jgi:hypothetical protein
MLDVFVASDGESIAASEDWFGSIDTELRQSALMLILCSPASIRRPWLNFEAGAAWILEVPIVPLCHLGLESGDLRLPLSLRQGLSLNEPNGLRQLYTQVAKVRSCATPDRSFEDLAEARRQAAAGVRVQEAALALVV